MISSAELREDLSEPVIPEWVSRRLVEGTLPWGEALTVAYEEFDARFSLHDSTWIGLFLDIAFWQSAKLAFIWDPAHQPEGLLERTSWVKKWPVLFIDIDKVTNIDTSSIVDLNYPRQVGSSSFCRFKNGTQQLTLDCDGGVIRIDFEGDCTFLAMSRSGDVITLRGDISDL